MREIIGVIKVEIKQGTDLSSGVIVNTCIENRGVQFSLMSLAEWHHSRNTIKGATNAQQLGKLMEEVGELAGNVVRGKCIKDDVGDVITVLVGMCERDGISISECVEAAYNDIKDRKGVMVDGNFIKEADLK